jgi:hypothetical protein
MKRILPKNSLKLQGGLRAGQGVALKTCLLGWLKDEQRGPIAVLWRYAHGVSVNRGRCCGGVWGHE